MKNQHDPNQTFQCDTCGEVLDTKSKLWYHKSTRHAVQKEMTCEIDGQVFGDKGKYDHHRKYYHSGEVQCDKCPKICGSLKALNRHVIFHTAEKDKKFPCDKCEKRFLSMRHLKAHDMNVHLKTRPYHCRYNCGGMSYNDISNRATHERKKHGALFTQKESIETS